MIVNVLSARKGKVGAEELKDHREATKLSWWLKDHREVLSL